tara:strand:+ start:53 stop:292 length:240 start_codon:yes stop_codon:yes gene_type:complete
MKKKPKPADLRLATSAHILKEKAQTKQERHKLVPSAIRIPSAAVNFESLLQNTEVDDHEVEETEEETHEEGLMVKYPNR